MSYYYNYKFTDTKRLYARIKEELSSYFEAGLLDDTLLDLYVIDCLDSLGKGTRRIAETMYEVKDHIVDLPEDLFDIREVWMCHTEARDWELPTYTYVAKMKETAHKLWEDVDVRCRPCDSCKNPNKVEAVYKITNTVIFQWERKHRLYPKPIIDVHRCHEKNIYDIQDCRLITPIKEGYLNLIYYVDAQAGDENLAIPDNYKILKYMEEYIKYKLFLNLLNKVSDESVNIIERKMLYHQQRYEEAFVSARIENLKDTKEKKIQRFNKMILANNKYERPRVYYRNARY